MTIILVITGLVFRLKRRFLDLRVSLIYTRKNDLVAIHDRNPPGIGQWQSSWLF